MKVKYDTKKREWIELPPHSKEEGSIYLDGFLKKRLDKVRKLIDENWDAPILIDGPERSGKSTLAMTIGYYLSDTQLTANNFATGLTDCAKKIKEVPDKSILIVDEGSLVFSSKDAMSRAQKQLMKILDVVGQKNLIIIICLPSFFDLNKQIAIRRSRFLLHVYHTQNWKRGQFSYFSARKKRWLYELGRKNFGSYKKPKPTFIGSFVDFKPHFYEEYLEIKKKSMMEALDVGAKEVNLSTYKTELMVKFKENCPDIPNLIIAKGFGISKSEYYRRMTTYKGIEGSQDPD